MAVTAESKVILDHDAEEGRSRSGAAMSGPSGSIRASNQVAVTEVGLEELMHLKHRNPYRKNIGPGHIRIQLRPWNCHQRRLP